MKKDTGKVKSHIAIREATRDFATWQALVTQTGSYIIEGDTADRGVIAISFYDIIKVIDAYTPEYWKSNKYPVFPLRDAFELSARKKEAIYYNVIRDLKQKDVAAIMGITTVSVGQYVESGFLQITNKLFGDE